MNRQQRRSRLAPAFPLFGGKLATTLTAAPINDRATTSAGFTWQVTSNRPGPLVYSSSAPERATITSSAFVTMAGGVGLVTVAAAQAATATHKAGYIAIAFEVVLGTPTSPGSARLRGGGFAETANRYTPPTKEWTTANNNYGLVTLTDGDGMNILIQDKRYSDTYSPSGIYTGNTLESDPVIRLAFSTFAPREIVVEYCSFNTRRPIITGQGRGCHIIFRNNNAIGEPFPTGLFGRAMGHIFSVSDCHVTFENNFTSGLTGVYSASNNANTKFILRRNRMQNINGFMRMENGQVWTTIRQFAQLQNGNAPRILVEDNVFSNDLNTEFYVEDDLSFYSAACDPAFPGVIQRNFHDTGGYHRSTRLVYNFRGEVQNGYSGTSGMAEAGTKYIQWLNNTSLQHSAGFYTYAENQRYEGNTVVSTGRYEYGPEQGKIIPMSNGAFAAPDGRAKNNRWVNNRTAHCYHNRNDFELALEGATDMTNDTIQQVAFGTIAEDVGNVVESHGSWNLDNRTIENPPFQKQFPQNNPNPFDWGGKGLGDNALVSMIRMAENTRIANLPYRIAPFQ